MFLRAAMLWHTQACAAGVFLWSTQITVPGAAALLSTTRQFNWLPYQLGRVVFHLGSLQSILWLTSLRTEGESVLGFLLLACLLVLLLLGFCCLVYVPEGAVFWEGDAGKSLADLWGQRSQITPGAFKRHLYKLLWFDLQLLNSLTVSETICTE